MSWLSGWGKRIKLTVDHLKVDEDLTNFPIMIHLASGTGRTNADVSDVFDELDYDVNDDFTGTDGDSPDSDKWGIVAGAPSVSSNKLDISVDSTKTNLRIKSNYKLVGDFDIQMDFSMPSYPSTNSWALNLFVEGEDGTTYKNRIEYSGYGHVYHTFRGDTQGYLLDGTTTTTDLSGKLRITRIGNIFKGYYWNGSSWTQIGSGLTITGMGNCQSNIRGECWDSTPTVTMYADNFIVNSGNVFWPRKTFPNRKKLLLTDNSDTPLYMEIDHWNQANKKAYLWAKVPTVYSGSDTDLYLYYDSSQPDNDNYVGDTGDLVSLNVWDSNFKAVYHLSQDPTGGNGCILDSTSNVNNGTPAGSMTSDDLVDGLVGKGLDFDGTNDYVNCGNDSSLDITNKISLAACYYSYNRGDWEVLICKGQAFPNDLYGLHYESSTNKVAFVLNFTTAGRSSSECIFNLKDGFHLIEGTYDGNNMKLYIDGNLKNTVNIGSDTIKTDTSSLLIGDRNNNTVYAKGIVDESRISNIARSPAWIKSTYYSNFDNLITFGSRELEPKYYYHGFIKEHNVPVSRLVRLYDRNSGKLMDEAISRESDGYYYLTTSISGEHFIVAFDDDVGEDFNALVLDKLMPRGKE